MNSVDEIILRIKKAIRLANRTTSDGERDTAMRLARNLAEKNGVAFEDIKVDEADTAKALKVDDEEKKWISGSEVGYVCHILHRHFGVIVMFNRYGTGKMTISWFGSRLNIDIARHVWHILMRESQKAWDKERGKIATAWLDLENRVRKECGLIPMSHAKIPHGKRGAFMQGFFWAIDQKLTEHPLRNDVDADRKAAEKKFEDFKENNKVKEKTSNKKNTQDVETVLNGMREGKKVNLNRPCEGSATSPLALTA